MKGVALILGLAAATAASLPAAAQPRTSWSLRFDLLSPAGITCTADAPDASVRSGRDLFGKPWIIVTGDVSTATITCTAPDGSRWQTALPMHSKERLATRTRALAAWRPQPSRMTLQVRSRDSDNSPVPERHRFTRLP